MRLALLFALLLVPSLVHAQQPAHGADAAWAVQAGGLTGDDAFWCTFTRGTESVSLGSSISYDTPGAQYEPRGAAQENVDYVTWQHRERAAYLASATSFRDRALLRLGQLRAAIEAAGRDHQLTYCDRNDPDSFREIRSGNAIGIMGCVQRPLTPAQVATTLAAMRTELDRRVRLVRVHYRAWYAALRAMAPPAP